MTERIYTGLFISAVVYVPFDIRYQLSAQTIRSCMLSSNAVSDSGSGLGILGIIKSKISGEGKGRAVYSKLIQKINKRVRDVKYSAIPIGQSGRLGMPLINNLATGIVLFRYSCCFLW